MVSRILSYVCTLDASGFNVLCSFLMIGHGWHITCVSSSCKVNNEMRCGIKSTKYKGRGGKGMWIYMGDLLCIFR